MSERMMAPVVLFTYNRPEHTKHTIEALAANELAEKTELFVFSDAAKKEADAAKVQEIREYVGTVQGFANVSLIVRKENYGLARNVIEGVTEIVNRYGRVIVLEDDLVTNRYFLRFMNDGLDRYEKEKQVTGVTGFSFLDDRTDYDSESYLCGLTGTSWSWATWADRWSYFDAEALGWEKLKTDTAYRRRFNYDNTYNFYQLLKMQKQDEKTNSWAIRWYASAFLADKLTLHSGNNLIQNIGLAGTHINAENNFFPDISPPKNIPLKKIPVTVSSVAEQTYFQFFSESGTRIQYLNRIKRTVKYLLPYGLIVWYQKRKNSPCSSKNN